MSIDGAEDVVPTPGEFASRAGDVPMGRIIIQPPPGTATEEDVQRLLHAPASESAS